LTSPSSPTSSRRLFEALRLEIHYDYSARSATCRVTLLGDTIEAVSRTTQEAVVIPFPKQKGPAMEILDLPSGTVCVVPPAGSPKDGTGLDQRLSAGTLVVEANFELSTPVSSDYSRPPAPA
jgi:hypothetical protein